MTTLEFMQKQRNQALRNLVHSMDKPGVTEDEKRALQEKIEHYNVVIRVLEREGKGNAEKEIS